MQKLTDSAKLSEQLTVANEELTRLRAGQQRAARTAPGATTGTWAAATRQLPRGDRARIPDASTAPATSSAGRGARDGWRTPAGSTASWEPSSAGLPVSHSARERNGTQRHRNRT